MEIKELDFSLTKEIQINFCTCDLPRLSSIKNSKPKRSVIENKVYNNRTPKLNMACVCKGVQSHAILGENC